MRVHEIVMSIINNIHDEPELKPSEFIKKYWKRYKNQFESNQNINGKVFEELIAIALIRSNILPFYMQASVAFIPNVNYDFIIYSKVQGPIVLSAKTSLRERYKQADLEAAALKYVHRKSESHVLSLNSNEIEVRQRNMDGIMAIDTFVDARSSDFDDLITQLAQKEVILPEPIKIVTSSYIITSENSLERYS